MNRKFWLCLIIFAAAFVLFSGYCFASEREAVIAKELDCILTYMTQGQKLEWGDVCYTDLGIDKKDEEQKPVMLVSGDIVIEGYKRSSGKKKSIEIEVVDAVEEIGEIEEISEIEELEELDELDEMVGMNKKVADFPEIYENHDDLAKNCKIFSSN